MKQLFDFIPLIVFFSAYKMYDIYVATAVLIAATVIQYGSTLLITKKLEKGQWVTVIAVLLFGGVTLVLRDETFLKWKAPIVNWLFAAVFLGSQFIGEKSLVERVMGGAIDLPKQIWRRLNLSWVAFFLVTGSANYYVAFNYHEYWVDFKVFGSLGITFVFMILQTVYLFRHIKPEEENEPQKP
ncbi:MAG: septation protein A [Pseudomonadales bacterium]|nr:septation protein A [Pseudomonadales bacterium]